MADAMKVAETRREEYKKDIAKKEAEIEELKELISDLDNFIEFGESLIGDSPAETKPAEKPAEVSAPEPKPETDAQPQAQVQEQAPQPRVVKSRQPNGDWDNPNEQSGIARVLAARNA